ncbi:MAG: hypothetical protein AVO33_04340 [delta proteobacterium ML8_F1]|nr:MAG: hypothetical protein AVO33_04340 [delta proteobacterium ML8_F1]
MKHRGASSYIKLAGTAALFFVIYFLLASPVMVMTISHQETGDIYWSQRVHARDVLEYEWIHSFELIPYTEEFVIEEEGSLRLMTITVAGFGAGIPENKGDMTIRDGLVVMENINEIFEAIKWIHTTTNLTRINLNGEEILKGTDLPHHEAFYLEVEERSRIWTLQN